MKHNLDLDDFDPLRSLVKENKKNHDEFNLDINENHYSDRELSEKSYQTDLNSQKGQIQDFGINNQPFIINFS